MTPDYFIVRKSGDRYEMRGVPSRCLGHRLESVNGGAPDGVFAQWNWDGDGLTVQNDRYGFYPLYYYLRTNEIGISSSIPALLAQGAPAELDDTALAVFLRTGFFLGEDTAFVSIRALPPNAVLRWSAERFSLSGGSFCPVPQSLTRAQAIEGYAALFREAMGRRLPKEENFAVPLSGGRDSRHILLELCERGRKPRVCVTVRHFPPRANRDVQAAAELAAALEVPHVVLDQPASRFQAEQRKNALTGFCSDEHTQFLPIADYLGGRVHTLYDGIAGDILSTGAFLKELNVTWFETERYTELAEAILNLKCNTLPAEDEIARLLPHEMQRRFSRERALHRLSEELQKHRNTPNPISQFYFWNRTRREIALAPYALFASVGQVFSPYLDHALYDFLASLPASLVADTALHSETIARAYPRFAHIPYDASDYAYDWRSAASRRFFRRWTFELGRSLAASPSTLVAKSGTLSHLACRLPNGGGYVAKFGPILQFLSELERAATFSTAPLSVPACVLPKRRSGSRLERPAHRRHTPTLLR